MMDDDLKERWVEALTSGKYQQGNSCLRYNDKYCCLGVLADLLVQDGIGRWYTSETTIPSYGMDLADKSSICLPENIREKITISKETLSMLITMNDQGFTFEQIAGIIKGSKI